MRSTTAQTATAPTRNNSSKQRANRRFTGIPPFASILEESSLACQCANCKKTAWSVEHNDESKRDVPLTKTTPDHWADYDKVFIGYPIWWGIAAWPVNNFVKGNDFSGKTVIPFCTSSSSGLGQSGDLLADMAGTGNWQDGERFSSGASSSKVESWVNGLDLK